MNPNDLYHPAIIEGFWSLIVALVLSNAVANFNETIPVSFSINYKYLPICEGRNILKS